MVGCSIHSGSLGHTGSARHHHHWISGQHTLSASYRSVLSTSLPLLFRFIEACFGMEDPWHTPPYFTRRTPSIAHSTLEISTG